MQAVARLKDLGIVNVTSAFIVKGEVSAKGEPIGAEIFWVKYSSPKDVGLYCLQVEGKLYFPSHNFNGTMIHMTPGFPGGNAGRFETLYAKGFVEAGYAFSTLRYNGTSLVGPDAAEILNCSQRIEIGAWNSETHLGGYIEGGRDIDGVIREPIAVLRAFGESQLFRRIALIGHSMGAASNNYAVSQLAAVCPKITQKISHVVGIAGYVGKNREQDGIWDGFKMPFEELMKYELERFVEKQVNFTATPKAFREGLTQICEENTLVELPLHINQIYMLSEGDELIAPPADDIRAYGPYGDKKLIVIDKSHLSAKQHSMMWLTNEDLIAAVEADVSEPTLKVVPQMPSVAKTIREATATN